MALNKIYTLNNTEIHTWAERDRLLVELRRKSDDKTLIEWRDEEVNEAVEDGFLPFGPDSRGHGNRELHVAALDYYNARFKKNPMKIRRKRRTKQEIEADRKKYWAEYHRRMAEGRHAPVKSAPVKSATVKSAPVKNKQERKAHYIQTGDYGYDQLNRHPETDGVRLRLVPSGRRVDYDYIKAWREKQRAAGLPLPQFLSNRAKVNPMKIRRNARISPADIAALRRILFAHSSNPRARPGERDIPTEIIKRRKNPRKKVKLIGRGCRWKTKKDMMRYMAKIRRLAKKSHRKSRKARR